MYCFSSPPFGHSSPRFDENVCWVTLCSSARDAIPSLMNLSHWDGWGWLTLWPAWGGEAPNYCLIVKIIVVCQLWPVFDEPRRTQLLRQTNADHLEIKTVEKTRLYLLPTGKISRYLDWPHLELAHSKYQVSNTFSGTFWHFFHTL